MVSGRSLPAGHLFDHAALGCNEEKYTLFSEREMIRMGESLIFSGLMITALCIRVYNLKVRFEPSINQYLLL